MPPLRRTREAVPFAGTSSKLQEGASRQSSASVSPHVLRIPIFVLFALCLVTMPAMAGTASDPEVEDERGDVDVQHLVDADIIDGETDAPEEIETAADVLRSWIDKETEESFEVNVQLADLPDDASSPIVEVWAHFTIRDGTYHAAATLSSPQDGAPVQGSYTLYLDEANVGDLSGDVDADQDVVSFRVPKASVRDPGEGDALTRFHVTTHEPVSGAALDYAPGTNERSLPSILEAEEADPTDLDLAADARFGRSYAFDGFTEPTSRLSVDVTPSSLEVPAGEEGSFAVRIVNDADVAEDVSVTSSNAPPGWAARVAPSSVTVPAHGSQTVSLSVTPADDADGHELLDVNVVGEHGADKGVSVSVVAIQPDEGGDPSPTTDRSGDRSPSAGSSSDDGSGPGSASGDDDGAGSASDAEAEPGTNASQEADEVAFLSAVAVLFALAAATLAACART